MFFPQSDSGGPLTYKQGDQHVLIGVTSFSTGPGINPLNINLQAFFPGLQALLCGQDSGFCKVSDPDIWNWLDKALREMGAENCHFGYNAD